MEKILEKVRSMPPLSPAETQQLSNRVFAGGFVARQRRAEEAARREKDERLNREVATVRLLEDIRQELQVQRTELQKQASMLREHEEELTRIRTGGVGRPSAMHLILGELERRGVERKLADTQIGEARVLSRWLPKAHPQAARPTAKTITNNAEFRARYRQFQGPKPHPQAPKMT